MIKSKLILILTILFGLFCFGFATAEEKPLISQVQITGGSGHTADDFVEIFNPNSAPFNLKDYRLVKRTKTGNTDTSLKSWTADTYIPARSFYLWANSGFTGISVVPDVTTTGSIANDNGVALRQGAEDTGALVDSVAWGAANNGFIVVTSQNSGPNEALLRSDIYNSASGFVIGLSNPRNSSITEIGSPAPTPAPSPNPAIAPVTNIAPTYETKSLYLKITEILPNPEGEDSGAESVEIYNSGTATVDLDGWYLDDKNLGVLKTSAWQISQITIGPGEYMVLTIPKNKFSLNNSGGDSVNLYFSDKTLADSVSYTEDAKENISYQKFQSAWVWSALSLGKENFGQTAQIVGASQIYINEIFANPEGADEGNEWVEIYNSSNEAVNLKGFVLDNGKDNQSSLTNALTLDEKAVLQAKSFLQVKIPEDKFLLANSGGNLRFFDPSGKILETISFPALVEARSYSKNSEGKWELAFPTSGQINVSQHEENKILISELLASPSQEQDEFVEFYNTSTSTEVNLSGFILQIGNRSLKMLDRKIFPNGYLVIAGDDLPGHLPNAGGQVALIDFYGRVLSKINYTQAKSGQSFSLTSDGEYEWTKNSTPGMVNEFVQGDSVVASLVSLEKETTRQEKKIEKKLKNENIELKRDILDLSNQVALLSQKIDDLSVNLNFEKTVPLLPASIETNPSEQAQKPTSGIKYLFISGLALVGLLTIGFKYAKNVL